MLWNATAHPCDPFLTNNHNMTRVIVEKHSFFVLNVQLKVKLRFKKRFIDFKNYYILLLP